MTQAAYVNSVPLPQDDPANADPNGLIPTGDALDAMAPDAAQTQDVGAAMDSMEMDDFSAGIASGRTMNITTQAQWDALSPHEKAVVRATMASGGTLRSSDALRVYQDSVKRARASEVQSVRTSDGRTVDMVNGQIIPPEKQHEPVKLEIKQADDGTMVMIDPTTGRSFPAWMESDGSAVRGQSKLSATQEDNIKRLQMQSESLGARLNDLTRYTEDDKVSYDDKIGSYASAPFMGTKVKNLRAELEREKSDYDKRIETALRPINRQQPQQSTTPNPTPAAPARSATPSPTPNPTPTPTPTPNPMPTPEKFTVGKRYRDAKGNTATYRGNGVWE